jgi:hypothetical protein
LSVATEYNARLRARYKQENPEISKHQDVPKQP